MDYQVNVHEYLVHCTDASPINQKAYGLWLRQETEVDIWEEKKLGTEPEVGEKIVHD